MSEIVVGDRVYVNPVEIPYIVDGEGLRDWVTTVRQIIPKTSAEADLIAVGDYEQPETWSWFQRYMLIKEID